MPDELVRYIGHEEVNLAAHDGELRPVVGVHNFQVLRANRSHRELADGWGWTYNHGPMLAHWNGRFYLEYLSNPVSEHTPPGQTFITTSADGRCWSQPEIIFPVYAVPDNVYDSPDKPRLGAGTQSVMHQRMGFYIAPNGRFLVLGFYGVCSNPRDFPNDGTGIGRVVREVHADGSFGAIYFIRLNRHAGWNEHNVGYPLYCSSPDKGFVEACEALLADRLATLQWWEEDRSQDGFYAVQGYSALSYYHLPDGNVVGLWKFSKAAMSADEGRTWSLVVDVPSLVMSGGKVWGQRTSDGRFALVYNPSPFGTHRWPLAVVTGDGRTFADMLAVHGEVSPRRYFGFLKDFGPQYIRGIAEKTGESPDGSMWLTYSMNKEDIWISRVPAPIRGRVERPVDDDFSGAPVGAPPAEWNVYSPRWAPVSVAAFPGDDDRSLELRDADPCDYAKAERVFPESVTLTIETRLMARGTGTGELHVEVVDGRGRAALRLVLSPDGVLRANKADEAVELGPYAAGEWYDLTMTVDATTKQSTVAVDGRQCYRGAFADASVASLERVRFRTGPARTEPTQATHLYAPGDVPSALADSPAEEAVFYVNRLVTRDHVRA